jgi:CheY-like chemotaxis protein
MLLIVEDNAIMRVFIKSLVQRNHWRAVFAEDGAQALELYQAHKADLSLVFMDWNLPGACDGLGCAAEIRKYDANLPIIALTAHASKEHELECINAGMNGFITKPFTTAQFASAVDLWRGSGRKVSS